MVTNHTVDADGEGTAGIRWYEFRDMSEDGSWELYQQGTYAPDDGLNRWMGSVAMNSDGAIGLIYSVSNGTDTPPSIRYTGRPQGAPLGQMTFQEETIYEGEASQTGSARWGDYSALDIDPSNGTTFWGTHQYGADISGQFNWDTRVTAFQFDVDDTTPPEAIADLSASSTGATGVDLTWTAPTDPPEDDPAGGYDIRYSTDPIEDTTDFVNAQQVEDAPSPSEPGETDSASVAGLMPDTQYYFAIRSSDFAGNTSDLSNVPTATTDAAPIVGVDPDSLSKTLTTGESGSDVLSVLNEGAGTLSFTLAPEIGGTEISDPLGGNAPTTTSADDFPEGKYEPSIGPPPENGTPTVKAPQQRIFQPELGETAYYGVNSGADATEFASFLGNNPETLDILGSYPGSAFPNAGDFPNDDNSVAYELDADGNLRTVNVETGEFSEIGNVGSPGNGWTGMATNPNSGQIYVHTGTTLYTLDPDAPSVQEVGGFGGVSLMIGLAIDGEGTMYGYSVQTDALYEINKQTGEATQIGSIGFDANFGQGLTWDTKNGVLLMSAFNNATFQGEFRSVDPETGSTELIGVLGADTPSGTNQLGWLATPIDAIPQWLTAAPTEGDVEAGGSQDIDLSFMTAFESEDEGDLVGGLDYMADVVVETNDPATPTTSVPVTLTVEGNPAIGFSDDPVNFGQVFAGTSQTDTLSVINESDDAILQVANLQIDGEAFSLGNSSSFVLDPGESMGLPVTFTPEESTTYDGTLSLASSAGDQEIGLTGQGVPFVSIEPDSLSQTIDLASGDSMATDEFTVTNEFSESLPFDVVIEALEGSNNSLDLKPKLADEELRRWRQIQQRSPKASEAEPSLQPAPNQGGGGQSAINRFFATQVNDPVGVTAYGNEVIAPEIVSFDIGEPGAFSVLGEGVDSFAGNFTFGNNDQIFWIDNADNSLKTYALDDGAVETIGELEPVGSEVTWTDMETDPTTGTTYVTTGEGNTNRLYEVDVDDAELTPVGTFADGNLVVAFAIDDQGPRARVVELERDGPGIESRVDRVQHRPAHRHAVVRLEHRRDVGQQCGNRVTAAHALAGEGRSEPARAPVEVAVRVAQGAVDDGRVLRHDAGGALQERQGRQRLEVRGIAVEIGIERVGHRVDRLPGNLFVRPLRRALLDEGVDAFLGVALEHVVDHDLRGVLVGVRERHLALLVEGPLARGEGHARLGGDLAGDARGVLGQFLLGHDPVEQADLGGAFRLDEIAGEQHLHGELVLDVARQRDHRGRAEQADVDAGRREAEVRRTKSVKQERLDVAGVHRPVRLELLQDRLGEAVELDHVQRAPVRIDRPGPHGRRDDRLAAAQGLDDLGREARPRVDGRDHHVRLAQPRWIVGDEPGELDVGVTDVLRRAVTDEPEQRARALGDDLRHDMPHRLADRLLVDRVAVVGAEEHDLRIIARRRRGGIELPGVEALRNDQDFVGVGPAAHHRRIVLADGHEQIALLRGMAFDRPDPRRQHQPPRIVPGLGQVHAVLDVVREIGPGHAEAARQQHPVEAREPVVADQEVKTLLLEQGGRPAVELAAEQKIVPFRKRDGLAATQPRDRIRRLRGNPRIMPRTLEMQQIELEMLRETADELPASRPGPGQGPMRIEDRQVQHPKPSMFLRRGRRRDVLWPLECRQPRGRKPLQRNR